MNWAWHCLNCLLTAGFCLKRLLTRISFSLLHRRHNIQLRLLNVGEGHICSSLSYSCFVDLSCHSSWYFSTPTWGSHSPLNTIPFNTSSVNSQPKVMVKLQFIWSSFSLLKNIFWFTIYILTL